MKSIRLTESDLHRIVKESVMTVLKEADYEVDIKEIAAKYAVSPGKVTDDEREKLRNAGFFFDRYGIVTDIIQNGRRIGKVINDKVKWY